MHKIESPEHASTGGVCAPLDNLFWRYSAYHASVVRALSSRALNEALVPSDSGFEKLSFRAVRLAPQPVAKTILRFLLDKKYTDYELIGRGEESIAFRKGDQVTKVDYRV